MVLFLALVANGRPIGAGDARPTERVAASLVHELDFDIGEYPEVEDPFARTVSGRRVSIYPVLAGVLAAPVFAVAGQAFLLDETGMALAGKWAASLMTAVAAALFFVFVGRRHEHDQARWTAVVFALGTTMWSTSQALWQHPAAVLGLCTALLMLGLADYDPRWAARAGLPLALAVAARHADVVLVAILAIFIAFRWPREMPRFALWAAPAVAFVIAYQWVYFGSPLRHGFSGSAGRFAEPWGIGQAGLLVSPAKGLLVFTPVVLVAVVGAVRAFRRGDRWLPCALGTAALAHLVFMGRWSEWHGGESWGPRLMTDALPLLLAFLPEAFAALPRATVVLSAISIAVQALGAFAYDYRWERLHWRGSGDAAVLWDVAKSPIPFYARRGVVILAAPKVRDGRVFVREHPLVLRGGAGSRIAFAGDGPALTGGEATMTDVHLQRGARVEGGRVRLRGRWDGVFLRVAPSARPRRLELRIAGRGSGVLYVGERTFWTEPRYATYPVSGAFQIRHRYFHPESGGPDVVVTIGRAPGEVEITSIALVPPGEPEAKIRLRP